MSKTEPFVIERVYDAPVERVWKALTDKNDMKKWYFDIAEFEPVVGFEFRFEGRNEKINKTYLHLCKIEVVIVNKKLSYSWRYEGHPGMSWVTFELSDEKGKTKLRLTHDGIETFPALPEFAKHNFEQGWTYLIGKSLAEFVEK